MSAIKIKVHPAGGHISTESLLRGLALFLFIVTVLTVLFAGTFPFDFALPPGGIERALRQEFDSRWMQYDPGNIDRGQNVLFFIPFGFALAAIVSPRRDRWIWQLALAIPAGAALSTVVELSQVLVSFRDPSVQDIWCNTLGSVCGAGVFVLCGDKVLRLAVQGMKRLRPLVKPQVLAIALSLYAAAQLVAPFMLRRPGDLSVWDAGMPLNIGNESTEDRPWHGSVSNVIIADRAATADEATQLFHGSNPAQLFGPSLLGHYRLMGKEASYADQTGILQPLTWHRQPPDDAIGADQPVPVDGEHWLTTGSAIAKGIYRIGQTSELTVAAMVHSPETDQHGPARIVSVSNGSTGHDFTIAQEYNDLTVRMRTALRSSPDLHVHDVFFDQRPHHVVVTHKQAQIVVYVDGYEAGRVEITPEAKMIWRLYPRNGFRIRIEKYGYRSYAAIYRLLVFIPFAALLGALLISTPWSRNTKRIAGVAIIAAMAVALELLLGTQAAGGFQIRNLAISLILGLGALGAMAVRPKRSRFWSKGQM